MFNHKTKSSASEKLVELDLLYKGFEVFIPSAYGGNYDLIVDVNGKLYRVQVKTGSEVSDNKIRVDVRKSSNAKERLYAEDAYDILAIVHEKSKKVAYFLKSEMTAKHSINMWLSEPNNLKGMHKDYQPLLFDYFTQFPVR